MSLPTNIQITNDSVFTYTSSGQGNKKTRVTASTLLDNVAVYGVKTNGSNQQFLTLQGNKKQDKFSDNIGSVQIAALLQPVKTSNPLDPNLYSFGVGDSADPNDNNVAANVRIWFQNDFPSQYSLINGYVGSTTQLNGSQIPSNFYLDLIAPAAQQYCVFEVAEFMIGNAWFGEIETFVELQLVDSSGNLMGVIYDSSKSSNDQGAAYSSIWNATFYINMNNYPNGIFLLPLIKFSSGGTATQVNFTIGDPKTDAAVSVDEV